MSETENLEVANEKKTVAKRGTRKSTKTTGASTGTKSRKTSSKSTDDSTSTEVKKAKKSSTAKKKSGDDTKEKKTKKTSTSKKKAEASSTEKKTKKTTGTRRRKTAVPKEEITNSNVVQKNLFDENETSVFEIASAPVPDNTEAALSVSKDQISLSFDDEQNEDVVTSTKETGMTKEEIVEEYRLMYSDEKPGEVKMTVYVPEDANGRKELNITYKDGDDIAAEEEAERKRIAEENAKLAEEKRRLEEEARKQAEEERLKNEAHRKQEADKQAAHERYLKEQASLKRKADSALEETMPLDKITAEIQAIELAENTVTEREDAPAPSLWSCIKDPIRYIQMMLDRNPDGIFTNLMRALFMWSMISLAYVNWFAKSVNAVAFSIARVNFSDGSWLFVRMTFIGILLELLTAFAACIVAKIAGLPYSFKEVFHRMSASDIPSGLLFAVCGLLMHFAPIPGLILSIAGWIFAFYTRALVLDHMMDMKNSRFVYFIMALYAIATLCAVFMFRSFCPDVFRILDSLLNI